MPLYRTGLVSDASFSPNTYRRRRASDPGPIVSRHKLADINDTAMRVMGSAVSEKTRIRKWGQANAFLSWCKKIYLTKAEMMPTPEPLLCNYIAEEFAGCTAGATAKAHIGAIKDLRLRQGVPWLGGDRLKKVLAGVEREATKSSHHQPRKPVKKEHLKLLREDAEKSNKGVGKLLCRNAIADTLFCSQMRAGEGLANSPNPDIYNAEKLPLVSDISKPNVRGIALLDLPSSKASQSRTAQVIVPASAVKSIIKHIAANKLEPHHPLFSHRNEDGKLRVMTKKEFLASCNSVWNIPKMTGHCFRIGGTTHYLLAGVSPDVVRVMGRWNSDAFLHYWRDLDSLAAVRLPRFLAQERHSKKFRRHSART